jgi:hypothetical protein
VAAGTGASIIVPRLRQKGLMSGNGLLEAASMAFADSIYEEVYPTSPLIVDPFSDELMVPKALSPVPPSVVAAWTDPPGPGNRTAELVAQRDPSAVAECDRLCRPDRLPDQAASEHALVHDIPGPADLVVGRADDLVRRHGQQVPAGMLRTLPPSTIYGFEGRSRPDDQRRVRQAGAGALREPSRREPAEPRPTGLR